MENKGKFPQWIVKVNKYIVSFVSKISKLFDRIIYSKKSSILVSFIAAVMICVAVNFDDITYVIFNKEDATLNVPAIPVEVNIDESKYQVSGIPETVDLVLTGNPVDIQVFRNKNTAKVEVDLRKFKEGTNEIPLQVKNIPPHLKADINPPTASVEIEKKVEKNFVIRPELLLGAGQKMDDFESPTLANRTVSIKATQGKINSIRRVEAIIDATGKLDDFEVNAPLVAYDTSGNRVDVEMDPSSVLVSVRLNKSKDKEDKEEDKEEKKEEE